MTFRNPVTTVSAGKITPGTLAPGVVLPAEQIGAGELSQLVIARALAAGIVTPAELADAAVTTEKIATGAVTADVIGAGAIVADKIAAGAITAAKLRADAIDGKTITGAIVRSAAAGNRFELKQNTGVGVLEFYAGIAGEQPATVKAETLPGATPAQMLTLAGDVNASGTRPVARLYSEAAPAGGWRSRIDLDAEAVYAGGRDLLGAWTAFTPQWVGAGANPSVGNGSLTGRYKLIGKTCHVEIQLVIGTSGVNGGIGAWSWFLPPFPAAAQTPVPGWLVAQNSHFAVVGGMIPAGTTYVTYVMEGRNMLAAGYDLGAGSVLVLAATYEVV